MDCIHNEKQVLEWKIMSSLVNELNLIRCLWFLWSCLVGYTKIMRDTPKTIVNLKFWWQGNLFFRFLGFSKPYSCQENFLCKSSSFKMITFQLPNSVQFSRSVVSDSLQPHELQHARPPVHHQLPEFTQTHVHWVGDAIQPSHPLLSPSPPAPNPSQHQSLFQWVNSSHEVAKVLEFQL